MQPSGRPIQHKEFMTQEYSIFNQDAGATTPENQGTPAGTASSQPNPLDTMLAGIKNERGEQKYKTVEDALKALGHSQNFIPQLQGQLEAATNQLTASQAQLAEIENLKDTVAKLTQKLTEQPGQTPGKSLSEEDIAEIVGRQLTAKQQKEAQERNTRSVVEAISKQFGDKASEVFYGKAQELGMTQDQINSLAASAPQAVLTMFGVSGGVAHKQTFNPPAGSVNTAGFSGTNSKSFIGRETNIKPLGATMQDTMDQVANSKRMVDELHQNGMSVHDLTDPKVFFKHISR